MATEAAHEPRVGVVGQELPREEDLQVVDEKAFDGGFAEVALHSVDEVGEMLVPGRARKGSQGNDSENLRRIAE